MQDDETLEHEINKQEREDIEQDLEEIEGTAHAIQRPSEDGDADMDLDERGGNQVNHETR